jgi:hypothetical protein
MPQGELYTRQERLELNVPQDVTVVGCGGIGSWVAIFCAMSGVPNIFLFDADVMEESNRNRLPFCEGSLNRPKVEVVADYLRAIRPQANIIPIADRLEGMLLDVQLSVGHNFIDCTDSPKAQYSIYKACLAHGVNYIRAGYDGTSITVAGGVSGWIRTDVEEENYAVNPSWVVPAVTVAALAVGKLMKYPRQEVSLDISEIGVPAIQRHRRLTPRCNQVPTRTRRR